jgi:hypothetical protein
MRNAFSAELLKLRRSLPLLLACVAAVLPPAVKCLRHAFGGLDRASTWRGFLASGQELAVFGMLTAVMLISAFIFTMEHQYGTAAALFTTGARRLAVFGAKMAVLAVVVAALLVLSVGSQLLFGALTAADGLTAAALGPLAAVTAWYAVSYVAIAGMVALPAVLTKRFTPTAVITLGSYILLFPFHAKNAYACPFLTPTIVAARMWGSTDYLFTFDYGKLSTGVIPAGGFLLCCAAVCLALGASVFARSDAVR